MSFKSRYRVDNVPLLIRPPFLLFSYLIGFSLYLYVRLVRFTARIKITHSEDTRKKVPLIYSLWHHNVWLYFVASRPFKRQVWLNHPDWYMKPVQVLMQLLGVEKLILGSSGRGGKEAAQELENYLRAGHSTLLVPDGPAGPPRVAKKGAFHVSRATGVPICPITIVAKGVIKLPSWEGKLFPLPFCRIKMTYGKSLRPGNDIAKFLDELTRAISNPS